MPSVNTVALGMFCGAKYTHHTFTPIIKHQQITTTANKHPGKKSFINKHMRNPTDFSHQQAQKQGHTHDAIFSKDMSTTVQRPEVAWQRCSAVLVKHPGCPANSPHGSVVGQVLQNIQRGHHHSAASKHTGKLTVMIQFHIAHPPNAVGALWATTLMRDNINESPPWRDGESPDTRQPWWETTLIKDHPHMSDNHDERPP